MHIGIVIPQGIGREYQGWNARDAWRRSAGIAEQAEALGFDSVWLYDHFHTDPGPSDDITFESFVSLTALASVTHTVGLGHMVLSAGYRNPALVAKMASTLDVVSDGRMMVGIGAGWKRDEWLGYGYGYPTTRERLEILADALEILTRLLGDGRASFEGQRSSADDAYNVPRGIQSPRVPITVGGNGPEVTWRLAARFADELNLNGLDPDEVAQSIPIIQRRCAETGRDPGTLRISVHLWGDLSHRSGSIRVKRLATYRELGVGRVIAQLHEAVGSDAVLESLADDARHAGVIHEA